MITKLNELLNWVHSQMGNCGAEAYPYLFEVRSQLNDILSDYYVKRKNRKA